MSSSLQRRITASLLLMCSVLLTQARPAPQFENLETGMLLAAAQVKGMIDAGGAAQKQQSVDFLGAKANTDMGAGFGDAVKSGMGRRRRRRRRRQLDEEASLEDYSQYSSADEDDVDTEYSLSDSDVDA